MNSLAQAQERARCFNEDEAVWRSYDHKRTLRHLRRAYIPLPEATLDWLDWQAAEQDCRELKAIGFLHA